MIDSLLVQSSIAALHKLLCGFLIGCASVCLSLLTLVPYIFTVFQSLVIPLKFNKYFLLFEHSHLFSISCFYEYNIFPASLSLVLIFLLLVIFVALFKHLSTFLYNTIDNYFILKMWILYSIYVLLYSIMLNIVLTFTFMHLVDTLIQKYLQYWNKSNS